MSEIPEDIKETASGLIGNYAFDPALLEGAIRAALLAERERSKKRWLEWHSKRSAIARKHWLRAAKKALDGDTLELLNRVHLYEAEPMDVVLSGSDEEQEHGLMPVYRASER